MSMAKKRYVTSESHHQFEITYIDLGNVLYPWLTIVDKAMDASIARTGQHFKVNKTPTTYHLNKDR